MRLQGDDWSRKIPVEAKVLLMQLLNIESKVSKGDQSNLPFQKEQMMNPKNVSLRELFELKPTLTGRRPEMGYEPYRMAKSEELSRIAHRSAIAAVDWVESLSEIGEFVDTEDKVRVAKMMKNEQNLDCACESLLCSIDDIQFFRKNSSKYQESGYFVSMQQILCSKSAATRI